jgi:hypothetical protein
MSEKERTNNNLQNLLQYQVPCPMVAYFREVKMDGLIVQIADGLFMQR